MICAICQNWARTGDSPFVPHLRSCDNLPLITDHHPGCPNYEDSLIDVWKVSYEGQSYYSKTEPYAEEVENGETVTQLKMHSEIFDQLPEFNGF